jgi:hypothetical protein
MPPCDLSYFINRLLYALVNSKLNDLVVHWKNDQSPIQVDEGMDLHMFVIMRMFRQIYCIVRLCLSKRGRSILSGISSHLETSF